MSDSWKNVYVRLYKDSNFCWFRNDRDRDLKGSVNMQVCLQRFVDKGHGGYSSTNHVKLIFSQTSNMVSKKV